MSANGSHLWPLTYRIATSHALPTSVTDRLDDKERAALTDAVARYIHETYATHSDASPAEIIASDPHLHHAFSVALWLIPETEKRIFTIYETNKDLRNAIAKQQERQKKKVAAALEFINQLPRSHHVATFLATTHTIEEEAKYFKTIFGDQSANEAGKHTFKLPHALTLINGLVQSHHATMEKTLLELEIVGESDVHQPYFTDLEEELNRNDGNSATAAIRAIEISAPYVGAEQLTTWLNIALRHDSSYVNTLGIKAIGNVAQYIDPEQLVLMLNESLLLDDPEVTSVAFEVFAVAEEYVDTEQIARWFDEALKDNRQYVAYSAIRVIGLLQRPDPVQLLGWVETALAHPSNHIRGNALVMLGHVASRIDKDKFVAIITEALTTEDFVVAGSASEAIGLAAPFTDENELITLLNTALMHTYRNGAFEALGIAAQYIDDKQQVSRWLNLGLASEDSNLRAQVLGAIGKLKQHDPQELKGWLDIALSDPQTHMRTAAIDTMRLTAQHLDTTYVMTALSKAIGSIKWRQSGTALEALGHLEQHDPKQLCKWLDASLKDPSDLIRHAAITTLQLIAQYLDREQLTQCLNIALQDEKPYIVETAIEILLSSLTQSDTTPTIDTRMAAVYSHLSDAAFNNIGYQKIMELYMEHRLKPSETLIRDWLKDPDIHKQSTACYIAHERKADPAEEEIIRYCELVIEGTLALQHDAKTFSTLLIIDKVPFEYPPIASDVPTTIMVDGKRWNLRLPRTPEELSINGANMDNCSGGSDYVKKIQDGSCIIVIAEPAVPDPVISLAEQTVNAEYRLDGEGWRPIQIMAYDDGRSGHSVPAGLHRLLDQPLEDFIAQQTPGTHLGVSQ